MLEIASAGGVFDAELEAGDHQADAKQRPAQLREKQDDGADPVQLEQLHAHVPHFSKEVAEEAYHLPIEPVDQIVHDGGRYKIKDKY